MNVNSLYVYSVNVPAGLLEANKPLWPVGREETLHGFNETMYVCFN